MGEYDGVSLGRERSDLLVQCHDFRSFLGARETGTWFLENTPVALAGLLLAVTYTRLPLSRVSYTLIFLFTCLHETGAHWTYAQVPYDDWWLEHFGVSLDGQLGFTRNQFDRLVHTPKSLRHRRKLAAPDHVPPQSQPDQGASEPRPPARR